MQKIHFSSSGTIFHFAVSKMQGSGINLDYRRDVFYAFFLILAKAASSSLDTGNFSPKAGE